MLFKLAKIEYHIDKPLTPKILSDPYHKVVQQLIYIYSMQSFIFEDLNRVCREKDRSKIKFYGAFAAALSFIINCANRNRVENKLDNKTTLFRGVKLDNQEINDFQIGSTINLLGYTSTSMCSKRALSFAFYDCNNHQTPVLFEILIKGASGAFELTKGFSAFPNEKEVLVQDGLTYKVTGNSEQVDPESNKSYRLINLSYPA